MKGKRKKFCSGRTRTGTIHSRSRRLHHRCTKATWQTRPSNLYARSPVTCLISNLCAQL